MPDTKPNAGLDTFERGLKRSKTCLKRVLRRLEGSKAQATFTALEPERRQMMIAAGAAIDRHIETLRKDLKAALTHGDPKGKA